MAERALEKLGAMLRSCVTAGISDTPFKPPGTRPGRARLRLLEHLQSQAVSQSILQPVESFTYWAKAGKFPAQAAAVLLAQGKDLPAA